MKCDLCGRDMYKSRVGWWCNAHRLRVSGIEAMREEERTTSAVIVMVCFTMIALIVLGSLFARGCQGAPAVADSICEQCGEIIGATDHGRCQSTEVASCE